MKKYKVRITFTGVVTKKSVAFIDDYDVEDFEIMSEEENGG